MKPSYDITPAILSLLADVAEKIGRVSEAYLESPRPALRKENRIKTIQASLEIEGNSLSLDQVTALLENKRILAPKKNVLEVQNAMVLSIMSKYVATMQKPDPEGYPKEPKTIGEHIKKRRMDLRLSQAKAAAVINVTTDCLCYWERGRSEPRLCLYPDIIAFLGYYPFDHETETFGGKIKKYKYEHGLSNEKLAKRLRVDEGTVAKWERNEKRPLARSLKNVLLAITKSATQ